MLHCFSFNAHLENTHKDADLISTIFPSHEVKHISNCSVHEFNLDNVKDGDILFMSGHSETKCDKTRKRGKRAEFILKDGNICEDLIYEMIARINGRITIIIDCCKSQYFSRVPNNMNCQYEFYCSSKENYFSFDSPNIGYSVFTMYFTQFYPSLKGSKLIDRINREFFNNRFRTRSFYKSNSPKMK